MSSLLLIGLKSTLVLAVALLAARWIPMVAAARHLMLVAAMLSLPMLAALNVLSPPAITFEATSLGVPWPFPASATAAAIEAGPPTPADAAEGPWPSVDPSHWYVLVCVGLLV